jgi:hypothetical protein
VYSINNSIIRHSAESPQRPEDNAINSVQPSANIISTIPDLKEPQGSSLDTCRATSVLEGTFNDLIHSYNPTFYFYLD